MRSGVILLMRDFKLRFHTCVQPYTFPTLAHEINLNAVQI